MKGRDLNGTIQIQRSLEIIVDMNVMINMHAFSNGGCFIFFKYVLFKDSTTDG